MGCLAYADETVLLTPAKYALSEMYKVTCIKVCYGYIALYLMLRICH